MIEEETVRVVHGAPRRPAREPAPEPKRSIAQSRVDDILEDVEARLRSSRDDLAYAIENMKIIMTPQHQNVELLIGQLIEQTIEYKRMYQ